MQPLCLILVDCLVSFLSRCHPHVWCARWEGNAKALAVDTSVAWVVQGKLLDMAT